MTDFSRPLFFRYGKKAGLSGSGFLLSCSAAHASVGQPALAEIEDPYENLQARPITYPDVIQAGYSRRALLNHPDRNPAAESTEMMRRLNLAKPTF